MVPSEPSRIEATVLDARPSQRIVRELAVAEHAHARAQGSGPDGSVARQIHGVDAVLSEPIGLRVGFGGDRVLSVRRRVSPPRCLPTQSSPLPPAIEYTTSRSNPSLVMRPCCSSLTHHSPPVTGGNHMRFSAVDKDRIAAVRRQPFRDGIGHKRAVAKALDAIGVSDPQVPFPVFKQRGNGLRRRGVDFLRAMRRRGN